MRILLWRCLLLSLLALAAGVLASCDESEESAQSCPDTPGTICPWAGTGAAGFNGDGKALTESNFYWPIDVTITSTGETYILDWNNHRVRRVTEQGTLETMIGTDFIGDGDPEQGDLVKPGVAGTTIDLNHPTQLVELGPNQLMLLAWHNHKLRMLDPTTGLVYVACGRGAGFTETETVEAALLNQPVSATLDAEGRIYLLDQRNQRIRRIDGLDPGSAVTTVVGTGEVGFEGDGGDPLQAKVSFPAGSNPPPGGGLAFDDQGRLYFSDINNDRVRRVDFEANTIETVLGDGNEDTLNNPRDIERGPDGRIYVADERNHRVLALDPETLAVEVVAGTGVQGDTGDFGPATGAQLNRPAGLEFDAEGNLYIADTYNHRVRMVRSVAAGE